MERFDRPNHEDPLAGGSLYKSYRQFKYYADNVVGRVWYEMRKGETLLANHCRFRVKPRHTIFLDAGQSPPEPYDPETGFHGDPDTPGEMWTRPNPALSDYRPLAQYALTVGGYHYADDNFGVDCFELDRIGSLLYSLTGKWLGTFDELRCCLFAEQRRLSHSDRYPEGKDLDYMRILYSAICQAWDRDVELVAHRPKKDPRDLRVPYPGRDNKRFARYVSDLLHIVYEEARDDPKSPPSLATGRNLRQDYPEREALQTQIPQLVKNHNLIGING